MKIMICTKCSSFVQLRTNVEKPCDCGAITGKYNADGDTITVTEGAVVMGCENNDILWAIHNRAYKDEGLRKVRAWIFNPSYEKITYVKKDL